jgi:hypothetical protein
LGERFIQFPPYSRDDGVVDHKSNLNQWQLASPKMNPCLKYKVKSPAPNKRIPLRFGNRLDNGSNSRLIKDGALYRAGNVPIQKTNSIPILAIGLFKGIVLIKIVYNHPHGSKIDPNPIRASLAPKIGILKL